MTDSLWLVSDRGVSDGLHPDLKDCVRDHWEREVCGSRYGAGLPSAEYFDTIDSNRYRLDYMLEDFARFDEARGKDVLEVGLGTGSDLCRWVQAGASASGVDLTEASIELVRARLDHRGLSADVRVGDAECLPFPDNSFDLYYSWGVLHHTPDTEAGIAEAHRVLRPGGSMKVMIYHSRSVAVFLIWLLYRVVRREHGSARQLLARHVESPGTKAYAVDEARAMVRRHFGDRPAEIHTHLAAGDLLTQMPSSQYQSRVWRAITVIYPRSFVSSILGDRLGSVMTIHAVK